MSLNNTKARVPLTLIATLAASLLAATSADAVPVKQIPAARYGAKVNATTGGNLCTVESGNTCQAAEESTIPGGFAYPSDVAVAPNGNLYVADDSNRRVQELKPDGEFVLMLGKGVNGKTGGDVCLAAEAINCKVGEEGTGVGEFSQPQGIAIDQETGDFLVADGANSNSRIQEFTPSGEFVLMFGKDVNEKTGGNVCTAAEAAVCKAGVPGLLGGTEEGALKLSQGPGDLLALGGPSHLIYVGEEHRIQEFDPENGEWKGEISLASISSEPFVDVQALAVDEAGDVYLTYYGSNYSSTLVYGFNTKGEEITEFPIGPPTSLGRTVRIDALAIEGSGAILAVGVIEGSGAGAGPAQLGSLYDPVTGHRITEFTTPFFATGGMTFSGQGELYVAGPGHTEVLAYKAVPVAELLTSAVPCKAGAEMETSATVDCTLSGQANPDGVSATKAWFQWGSTAGLGIETQKELTGEGNVPLPVSATAGGLKPNETYYYRLAGEDENVTTPELLTSETGTFKTETVTPRIVGSPAASFVSASSAVLLGTLNPENANSEYFFEYGPCDEDNPEMCAESAYTGVTPVLISGIYGKIETTAEATELQPSTVYHYRLVVGNAGGKANPAEGEPFTTAPAPAVQAVTQGANSLTSTSAIVSGSVNSDGQPASYEFELGVANGALTRYGVVFSGAVAASTTAVTESLQLTGLQPGTQYAYRIRILSPGYGEASGEAQAFTTAGLPEVLGVPSVLAQLPVPAIAFPKTTVSVTPKKLTRAQELASALKVCAKKPKSKRAACERTARNKYAVSKKARNVKR